MAYIHKITAILLLIPAGLAQVDITPLLTHFEFPDCSNETLAQNGICDTTAEPAARARALVDAMTIEEKLANMANKAAGLPRLGVPQYQWWNEALHGVALTFPHGPFDAAGDYASATQFPQPITMGAAFDDELIRNVGSVISDEARAFSNALKMGLNFWSPNVNPFRDPRWGRGQETPGEDSYHVSRYTEAMIDGMQRPRNLTFKKTVATCKHFAGYDLENWGAHMRNGFDAKISSQDLSEYYMPPFQACARDAKAGSITCSYNAVNGVPTCANSYLLQTVLREHWGWSDEDQVVIADCGATQNVYLPHQWSKTREQAVADSLTAGTDVDCGVYYTAFLPGALEQGLINESALDTSLIRQFSMLVRLGHFDPAESQPYRQINASAINSPRGQDLALRAAIEGTVLLKNDGTLPVNLANTSVALIGDWANATEQMQGSYNGRALFLRTPVEAAEQAGPNITVHYQPAVTPAWSPSTDLWGQAYEAIESSDVLIYIGGVDNTIEAENLDRQTISWSGAQLDMISRMAETRKPTIVVQMGGGQLDSSPLQSNPNVSALLWAGYPGQSGGTAIFDIITGKAAPAGRLPVTQYPSEYIDAVPMSDMSLRPGPNNPGRTYKWYNGSAVLPFGYGLHYTNFSSVISNKQSLNATYDINAIVSRCQSSIGAGTNGHIDRCIFATIDVAVHNTGARASDYVVLLFVGGKFGPEPRQNKSLVSYKRLLDLQPGAAVVTSNLNVTLGSLLRADNMGNKMLYPGSYRFMVDVPERDSIDFELVGEPIVVEEWPQSPEARRIDLEL
ncbi:glycoside hydrolase family 3 protein [Neofusicoccum parvum]|uniref:Glycoside hydrolase family 3 protein n=1 Tax=Neofusicoccum parvum TaxID=310453 RepID=A0ACB5SQJ4_9PEZI|nr:glycoside hydrolase family 3 protein [Neofusicoccum parvum]